MNSRCTSQQPGGAGSSEPSEGIITVIGGYSVAEAIGPWDFFPLITNGSCCFFVFVFFQKQFLGYMKGYNGKK